ncbi:hypothetical protein [Flavobacterium sp.]|uniref:hypothetical protein n=1 Tax=Flavobacterium sp. TaxID=239 RepID=UPI0039E6EDDA
MKVEFGLMALPYDWKKDIVFVLESELRSHPEKYLIEELSEPTNRHVGRFYMGEGGQHYAFKDSIAHAVHILCFLGVKQLAEGKPFEYIGFMNGKTTMYTPKDNLIEILPDVLDEVTRHYVKGDPIFLDRKRLLPALYQCGCRYLDFLTETLPHKGHEKSVPMLKPLADAALLALRQNGYGQD